MNTDKLKPCRENAPVALKNADDSALLDIMGDVYDKIHQNKEVPFYDVSTCKPVSLVSKSAQVVR